MKTLSLRSGFILPTTVFITVMLMILMGAIANLVKGSLNSSEMVFDIEADILSRTVVGETMRILRQHGTYRNGTAFGQPFYYSNYKDYPYLESNPPASWPNARKIGPIRGYMISWYTARMCAYNNSHASVMFCHVHTTKRNYSTSNEVVNQVAFLFNVKVEQIASGRTRFIAFYYNLPVVAPVLDKAYDRGNIYSAY